MCVYVCVSACMPRYMHACMRVCVHACVHVSVQFQETKFSGMFRYLKARCFPDNVFSNLQQAAFHTEDTKHQAPQRTL